MKHQRSPITRRAPLAVRPLFVACLFALICVTAAAQHVSVPGRRHPTESPAPAGEAPLEVKVARGEAPFGKLYGHIKLAPTAFRRLPTLEDGAAATKAGESDTVRKRLQTGVVRQLTNSHALAPGGDAPVFAVPGGEVSLIGVASEGALQVRAHVVEVNLPAGARLFVYSAANPEEVYGPFVGRGPLGTGDFWTPPVSGDAIVVEYFEPSGKRPDAQAAPFRVGQIAHIHTDPDAVQPKAAGSCNLNVSAEWAEVAKSVGRMSFISNGGSFACTGTLLNNSTNDGTPYFLTANHCISTPAEAQSLNVRWFYNSPTSPASNTLGSTLLATGLSSDFTLLRLTGALPGGVIFSGWSTQMPSAGVGVTGIHHPAGDYKRISFGSRRTSSCPSSVPQCVAVGWSQGTTEPGSSGSGIWTGTPSDARLVGTLHGGAASCDNLSGSDFYGRFDTTFNQISQHLNSGPPQPAPENDNFAAARALNGAMGTTSGSNVASTGEPGEPHHAGVGGTTRRSVWFRWTAPGTGQATFNTHGSDYDTLLAVYTGGAVNSLTAIASNDDDSTGGSNVDSTVTFNATAGTTYRIAVDGFSGATGSITLNWSGASASTNPIDNTDFFVGRHYLDFFGRQADAPGLAFWSGQITNCGTNPSCVDFQRQKVSGDFFLSIEFQETGYLVYRAHRAAYNNIGGLSWPVTMQNLLADMGQVGSGVIVGQDDWQARLEANQDAYFNSLAQTARFVQQFPATMTPAQFVDKLNQNAGGALSQAERDDLVNKLASNQLTRAQVVRAVSEDRTLYDSEYRKAFVYMQYVGYLRRDPDQLGFDFWLGKLNDHNGNYISSEMIRSFIVSGEYRGRFGQ